MASSIIIKVNSPAEAGYILQIQDSYTPSVLMDFQFETGDVDAKKIPITGSKLLDLLSIYNILSLAYNVSNRYIISVNYATYEITIIDNIGYSDFTEVFNNTSSDITTTINNEPASIPISIFNIGISENATDPCNLFDLTVETSSQATQITSPVVQAVNTNPIIIEGVSRNSLNSILVSIKDDTSNDADNIFVPVINSTTFDINISNSPTGGSVTAVFNLQPPDITFQYSLDNITFYNSSSFSNLPVGSYTMYIKDNIGCSTSIYFEITEFIANVYERLPFFEISEQNSLITIKREVIDNISVFKNMTNTLSYEEDTSINQINFKQLFQTKDGIITQQFKSNYEDVTIKLIDCENNEVEVIPTKKTENLNVTDVRDVTIISVSYSGGYFVGVQYGIGNTYDPDTLSVNGDYNLGTGTPDFMNVDDYIQIEGAGWFRVQDIVYVDNKETLILQATVTSFPIPLNQILRGTSIYNVLPYDVYEFSFDLNTLLGDYYITYNCTDSEFEEINFKTEWFNVSNIQEETYLLQYYNSENNETNYSTGIRNKIRIPYETELTYIPNDTQDIYLTDTNAVSIETTYRDLLSLECKRVPLGMVRKIGLAVSNDRLFLNGLSLLKNSELEVERVGVSNVYDVTIQFIRSDYAYTSTSEDGSIVIPSEVPVKVSGDSNGLLITK